MKLRELVGRLTTRSTGNAQEDLRALIASLAGVFRNADDTDKLGGYAWADPGKTVAADGITFPATQVASTDANTLDDYKEGDLTFGVTFGGGSTGLALSVNGGKYVKIGRLVVGGGRIVFSAKGSSTGAAVITGLPFTVPNSNANYASCFLRVENLTWTGQLQGLVTINTTTIGLEQVNSGTGALTNVTDTSFANNTGIILSFAYQV